VVALTQAEFDGLSMLERQALLPNVFFIQDEGFLVPLYAFLYPYILQMLTYLLMPGLLITHPLSLGMSSTLGHSMF